MTASAFSFVILNVGFLMSDKAQTTVITGMKGNNISFLTNVPGDFNTTTTACS
jgi:archaellin